MAIYSINDIENLTGIKAHTLRIWEKRYDLNYSKRTDTNIRYYAEDDLKIWLNIALLNKNGYKISKIAKLSIEEIRHLVAELSDVHVSHEAGIDALSLSIINLDQANFDKIVDKNIEQAGFEATLEKTIFPLFDKVNSMYLTGTIKPIHEAFLNHLVLSKLTRQIDIIRPENSESEIKFFLFQAANTGEELSVLILQYYLLILGYNAIHLGENLREKDIVYAYDVHKPNYIVGLYNASNDESTVRSFVDCMKNNCPESNILLSGYQVVVEGIQSTDNITVLKDLHAVLDYVREVNPA